MNNNMNHKIMFIRIKNNLIKKTNISISHPTIKYNHKITNSQLIFKLYKKW